MSPGPLRRTTAAVGLLSMVPIAVMVLTAALTPQEAAVRAVALVLAVLLVGNLVRIIITQLLHRVERAIPDDEFPTVGGAAGARGGPAADGVRNTPAAAAGDGLPRRRADDQVDAGRR